MYYHRLSNLHNRDWNPPTCGCHYVCYASAFRQQYFRPLLSIQSDNFPVSMMAATVSTTSPLESMVTVLRKLATEEFASERITRHVTIRRQIETLLESREELHSLCLTLHEGVTAVLANLPAKKGGRHSFQAALWPLFHTFRLREVPRIWKNAERAVPDLDAILIQKATMEYVVVLVQQIHGTQFSKYGTDHGETQKRREAVTLEEENAIRYTAGYVVVKLQEAYAHKGSVAVCQCLLSVATENSTTEIDEAPSFLAYTHTWLDIVNRGGLFIVSDEIYNFFLELELCVYPLLKGRLSKGSAQQSKKELVSTISESENVLFACSLVTTDLSEDMSQLLLKDAIQLWVTIRGFSITSRFLEDYKIAAKQMTKGKKPLRRELAQQFNDSS